MIEMMKIKVIKLSVGGCNSEIVWFDEEFLVDESEFSFKMKEKEEEGGGNEGCRFWRGFLRIMSLVGVRMKMGLSGMKMEGVVLWLKELMGV